MLSVYTIELFYCFSYFNLMSFNVILYYKSSFFTDCGNLTDVNSRVIIIIRPKLLHSTSGWIFISNDWVSD